MLLLGGWEKGFKGFFDAAASLDERGFCVWYYLLAPSSSSSSNSAVDGLILGMTMTDSFIYM